jgi:hypothetical protein
MPPLAELQRDFAHGVLHGEVPALAFGGRIAAADALRIHRNTVMGALTDALRISCPTVEALVGAEFFDGAAALFAEANPPTAASLMGYGDGFAAFLENFAPAAALPYLGDVARLDRAIERAAQAPARECHFALDGAVTLALPQSLAVITLTWPADLIRAALGDDTALGSIELVPAPRTIAVWRESRQVHVRRMGDAAGRFLRALLDGASAQAAFAAALSGGNRDGAIAQIQADVFAAPFCDVISKGDLP